MYKKILLAADGSDHATRAAHHAAHLATIEPDATITIVYVVDPASSKHEVIAEGRSSTYLEELRHERVRPVEEIVEQKGVSFDYKLLKGEPGPEIVHYANDEQYDVVVMGSRGLNTFQEVVLGSVSHKVAHGAKCPVMIVK
ncbi:universal stress protein [Pontibacillus yanchengensis]|uniref:Universal stress protein n=2 Tax=Pontibacillus yanchengensis TaxID=462910 RepID=A0ACC7VDZ3_9BACI|nr:universal stress protein [Pontibacillus yanchengensis]MYL32417.1 universal stress protein [Pontibacillus yanchengensis]MYL52998.1 universal stress protein [Pontibacillus yanchengensis]